MSHANESLKSINVTGQSNTVHVWVMLHTNAACHVWMSKSMESMRVTWWHWLSYESHSVNLERPPWLWEPFRARFPNRKRNRFVPVTQNVWPVCDICDCHKLSQIWICDRFFFSVFFSFFSKTGLVTFWSRMSQMVTLSIVTGTNLLLVLFRLKWLGTNEIRKNIPESELCFCFLFGIRLGTALTLRGMRVRVTEASAMRHHGYESHSMTLTLIW